MTKRVRIIRQDGSKSWGTVTDEHAASSYGMVVVVVDDEAHGAGDMQIAGMRIICNDRKTRARLLQAGYQPEATEIEKRMAAFRIRADIIEEVAAIANAERKSRNAIVETLLEEALMARKKKGGK